MERSIESEIESDARKCLYQANDGSDVHQHINYLLTFKLQIDNLNKGKQKPPNKMAGLYKRFALSSSETVIPMAQSLATRDYSLHPKI